MLDSSSTLLYLNDNDPYFPMKKLVIRAFFCYNETSFHS